MSRRQSPSARRVVPIKRIEGEPLTRSDLQYDFLRNVFIDTHAVFTNPWKAPPRDDSPPPKLTFCDLYIKTITNSTKSTKAFRDKMLESRSYAEDFCMIALLVNVGRINTTMSFFPEMKTAIRSYHPVPALQRTPGNLQDAPRIKHMLKAVTLQNEANGSPTLPANILSRLNSGLVPPTTVTNLIFVLANHSGPVGHAHFSDNIDFLDLFMRTDISSESRAKAFLWICFHYLENANTTNEDDYDSDVIVNPFGDPRKDGKPSFVHLTQEETASENVDPTEEKLLAEKLIEHRGNILNGVQTSDRTPSLNGSVGDGDEPALGEDVSVSSKGTKRKRENVSTRRSTTAKEKKPTTEKMPKVRKITVAGKPEDSPSKPQAAEMHRHMHDSRHARHLLFGTRNEYPPELGNQYSKETSSNQHSTEMVLDDNRLALYQKSSDIYQTSRSRHSLIPRTFLQHAWHKVVTVDALVDSDDEVGDEFTRHEYMGRLRAVTSILGSSPPSEVAPLPRQVPFPP